MLLLGSNTQVPNLGVASKVTLFDGYYNDGVNAALGVQHTSPKSGGGLMTLFDSNYDDGVNAVIGVQHTSPKSGGGLVSLFDVGCHFL